MAAAVCDNLPAAPPALSDPSALPPALQSPTQALHSMQDSRAGSHGRSFSPSPSPELIGAAAALPPSSSSSSSTADRITPPTSLDSTPSMPSATHDHTPSAAGVVPTAHDTTSPASASQAAPAPHDTKHDSLASSDAGSTRSSFFSAGHASMLSLAHPTSHREIIGDEDNLVDTHHAASAPRASRASNPSIEFGDAGGLEENQATPTLKEQPLLDKPPNAPATVSWEGAASERPAATATQLPLILDPIETEPEARHTLFSASMSDDEAVMSVSTELPPHAQLAPLVQSPDTITYASGFSDFALPVPDEHAAAHSPQREVEKADLVFWNRVVEDYQAVAKSEPERLAQAIQDGIPAAYRGAVWQEMSASRDAALVSKFHGYLSQPSEVDDKIERDLTRAYPEQIHFDAPQRQIFNVVKAYALHDSEVGYRPGLQFVVAPLLCVMGEAEAFATLVALMHTYNLRGHFLPGMPGLQVRLYQCSRLLEDQLPRLHAHLAQSGIQVRGYASQWLMMLFCYCCPAEVAYRVLDKVFADGVDFLCRFFLALLRANEATLLALTPRATATFLKRSVFDVYCLSDQGFGPAASTATTASVSAQEAEARMSADMGTQSPAVDVDRLMQDAQAAQALVDDSSLNRYAAEYQVSLARSDSAEIQALREATASLAARAKQLEEDMSRRQEGHMELVHQVVTATLNKDDVAEQLVQVKTSYAEAVLARERAIHTPRPASPVESGDGDRSESGSGNASRSSRAIARVSALSFGGRSTATDTSPASSAPAPGSYASAQAVAQSVGSTMASWGRWMSKSVKSAKAQPVATSTATEEGDTSAASVAVSASASHSGSGSGTPPPLPPRLPPRTRAPPALPARTPDSNPVPVAPTSASAFAETDALSVTPSGADEGGDEHELATPNGSRAPSRRPSRSQTQSQGSDMESVSLHELSI